MVPPLVAVEAIAFALPFWPRLPKWTFYPTTPAHRFLQTHLGRERSASQGYVLYPGTTTYYGLRSVTGHQFAQASWTDLLVALDPRALRLPTLPVIRGDHALLSSPILDRLAVRYFVGAPEDQVPGRRLDAPAATGTVALRAGTSAAVGVRAGRIRAVGLRIVDAPGWSGPGDVTVQVVDRTGAVISQGRRRFVSAPHGQITIPVPEPRPRGGTAPFRAEVRVTLRVPRGRLVLTSSGSRRPSLSLVMAEDDDLRLVFADGATIYQRLAALPRIRWAGRSTVIGDASERIGALAAGVNPEAVVLSRNGPPGSGRPARLRIRHDGDDEIRVSVAASGRGYLVIADAIQHGWKAQLDGRPVVLRDADHAGVAVLVPPGRHQVRVWYDPPGWGPGLVVSGIALVLLLALAVLLPARPVGYGSNP
jgi:hypothetical protein